jgi:hypothetical protein
MLSPPSLIIFKYEIGGLVPSPIIPMLIDGPGSTSAAWRVPRRSREKKLLQAGCKDAQAGPDACYVAVPASQSNESPKPIPGSFLCARLRLRVLQSALQKKKTSTPRLKTSSQILGGGGSSSYRGGCASPASSFSPFSLAPLTHVPVGIPPPLYSPPSSSEGHRSPGQKSSGLELGQILNSNQFGYYRSQLGMG